MSLLLFFRSQETGEPVPIVTTLDMVGALLRARTRDDNGVEQGTFTTRTRPTADEAKRLVDMATAQVSAAVGGEVPERAADAVQQAVALRAAWLIEASYFPEQLAAGDSPAAMFGELASAQVGAALALSQGDLSPGMGVYSVPVRSSTTTGWLGAPPILP